jgi:hypothetical protein
VLERKQAWDVPLGAQTERVNIQTKLASQSVDERCLSRARDSIEEIASAIWDTAFSVPLFAANEILAIGHDHVLNTCFEYDRLHRSFLAAPIPSPATPLVRNKDVNPVLGILLVFLLGFENELLDDGVVPRYDADLDLKVCAPVSGTFRASDPQPMAAVINCVGRIC